MKKFFAGLNKVFLCVGAFSYSVVATGSYKPNSEVIFQGQDVIWGFDFLSSDEMIFTERSGALKKLNLKTKAVTVITGVPPVWARGQGGLLDVRAKDGRIYFSYAEASRGSATTATTVVSVADLEGSSLKNIKKIFVGKEAASGGIHFGSRIEFDDQGHVFFTMGDRNQRDRVQSLKYNNGKVMRLKMDGSLPADNPFAKDKNALPEIWSFGHRNPQGLAWNPKTKELWEAEFGPAGGDELNLIKPGLNYGWPVITYGREYHGPAIGEGTEKPGMEQPITYYVPSISPSAIGFYHGSQFPKWAGNLFVANLGSTHLRRLVIENNKVVSQEVLLQDKGWRFRNVRQGPDELIYFSTDDGRIGKLTP